MHVLHCSRVWMSIAVVSGVLLAGPSTALADGKHFPIVGAEVDPTIPFQRALISYKDGAETLIVESTVDSPGERLGWVIPLPTEPTAITSCKPGVLKTMHQLTGPGISGSMRGLSTFTGLFAMSCVLASLLALRRRKREGATTSKSMARELVVVLLFVFLYASVLLPSLGTAGGAAGGPGAQVISSRQVGVYDVTVVAGESGEPIRAWLTDRGFRVPPEAEPVLDDYARRGWCFAASQIKAEDSASVTPHPLRFVFPSEEAVYPMALTGVGADRMQLDLFIIADKSARHPAMEPILVRRYVPKGGNLFAYEREGYRTDEPAVEYRAPNFFLGIGHPDAVAEMWPNCVVSHLRGVLDTDDMSKDFHFTWGPYGGYRKSVYTREHAVDLGFAVAWLTLGVGVIVLTRSCLGASVMPRRQLAARAACGLLFVPVAGLAAAWRLPSIDVGPKNTAPWALRHHRFVYASALEMAINQWPADGGFERAWPEFVQKACDQMEDDRFGRLEPVAGDVPGGYEIEAIPDGWMLTTYNEHGTPSRLRIGEDGKPIPAPPG